MLSIIIPTLNEEKYLPLLLNSIKRQSFTDYEIIVADAGSKDKTVDIARQYGCKVVAGGLLPKGRNEGAKTASGNIFLFIDSDIVLPHPKFIENALQKMKEKNLGLAVFPLMPYGGKKIDKIGLSVWNAWIKLTQKFFPHGASIFLVKKDIHEAVGGFDEEISFVEDQPYVASCQKVAKFGIIDDPVLVSVRRYEKDGRFNVYFKYILADLHLLFIGPIKSDKFNYKFGHYEESPNKDKK